jgi:hypothetical protein
MATKKKPAPKTDKPTSLDVTVFVPCGRVTRSEILKAALLYSQNDIPMAAIAVKPEIINASEIRTDDSGTNGRDYAVKITWTPRPTRASTAEEEDEAPATVNKVLESLEPLTAAKIDAITEGPPEA